MWLVSDLFSLGGGDDGIRTHDPLLAGQVLSQLSYTPIKVVVSSPFFFCAFALVGPLALSGAYARVFFALSRW